MSRTDNERVLRIESSAQKDEMEKIELKSLEYVSLRLRSVSKTQTMRNARHAAPARATPRETIARRATDDGTTTQRTYATAKGAAATADVKVRNVLRAMMARDDAVTARRAREGDSAR